MTTDRAKPPDDAKTLPRLESDADHASCSYLNQGILEETMIDNNIDVARLKHEDPTRIAGMKEETINMIRMNRETFGWPYNDCRAARVLFSPGELVTMQASDDAKRSSDADYRGLISDMDNQEKKKSEHELYMRDLAQQRIKRRKSHENFERAIQRNKEDTKNFLIRFRWE